MLVLNLIRTIAILFAVGLYHIYIGEFLSVDEGVVVATIAFFGLTLTEIVEDYVVKSFNRKDAGRNSGQSFR